MNNCIKASDNFKLVYNVLLHVLILFVIVNCLFIFIVNPLSESHFKSIFNDIVNTAIDDKISPVIKSRKDPKLVRELIIQNFNINTSQPVNKILVDRLTDYIVNLDPTNTKEILTKIEQNYRNTPDTLRDTINTSILKVLKN